ncbi:MAG: hypothetical protein ACXVBX_12000 [Flavisolibacter sp.]
MSRLFAMAIPITPGKEQEWRQFINELKDQRYEDFQASRRKLGVRERTFLQETPMGTLVVVTLEGENPEQAFANFAQSTDAFTKWFHERVKSIHNVDLSAPPPGPLPSLLIDSGPVEEFSSASLHN